MTSKYPFTALIESQVTHACLTIPRFMAVIGAHLDPEAMSSESAGLLIQAAQTITKASPCTSAGLALQALRTRVSVGQITNEQLKAAELFADVCEDVGDGLDLEGLIAVAGPVIRRAKHKVAVDDAMQDFGKGRDVSKAASEFLKIANIGTKSISLGHEGMGEISDIKECAESTLENPLPTGIHELDTLMMGGLEQHALGVVLGGSGDGKSLFLVQIAAESIFSGLNVAIITLELDEGTWRQRVYANLVNMSPREMKADPAEGNRRYQMLMKRPGRPLGRWVICYKTPFATSPADIRTWMKDLENEKNFKPDLLVIDYADKMVSSAAGAKQQRSYESMRDVYIDLRKLAHEEKVVQWLWTASQTKGRDGRKKKTGLEDTSDSAWKFREPDLILAITRTEEDLKNEEIRFGLPKRRNAPAHGDAGPLSMDAEHWRICALNRNEPW